jgi:3-methylcrotonyl-CoA carboxylase alpha subunit
LNSEAGVRIDTGVQQDDWITPHYDPMIAKVIVHGVDRLSALGKLERALEETVISGTETNRAFLLRLARDRDFARGEVDTGLIGRKQQVLTTEPEPEALDYAFAAIALLKAPKPKTDRRHAFDAWPDFRLFGRARQTVIFDGDEPAGVTIETDHRGDHHIETPIGPVSVSRTEFDEEQLILTVDGCRCRARTIRLDESVLIQRHGIAMVFALEAPGDAMTETGVGSIEAPMPGRIVDVHAKVGDIVHRGDTLVVLEAMKMEHTLTAIRDGTIAEVMVKSGDQVNQGTELLILEEDG